MEPDNKSDGGRWEDEVDSLYEAEEEDDDDIDDDEDDEELEDDEE